MTAHEYLRICGDVTRMKSFDTKKRSDEPLELVKFTNEKRKIKKFLRDMKRRFGIT